MKIILKLFCLIATLFVFSTCGVFQSNGENSQAVSATPSSENSNSRSSEPVHSEAISKSETTSDGIYIIFDASGSMWGQLADRSTKLNVAKKVLNEFVGGDFAGYDLALRVYGHRYKDDCEDSELVVPFGPPEQVTKPMRDFVAKTNALGRTPITYSLQKALADFGDRAGEIILITDGIESCDADPCALIKQWRETNVKVKVHVVGFGLDEKSKDALKCLSDAAGTDYFDAQSAKDLSEALKKIREKATERGVVLKGLDPSGKEVLTHGVLSQNGVEKYRISSNGRFMVESGEYQLSAGIQTINGNLYRPVSKPVTVSATDETSSASTSRFRRVSKRRSRTHRQKPDEVHSSASGRVASRSGRFDLSTRLLSTKEPLNSRHNPENTGEVTVPETFVAGDRKVVSFQLARAVKVFISAKASGSDIVFRKNAELWQNGVKKYTVHIANGELVQPGTYTVVIPDDLMPYEQPNVTVANRNDQRIEIDVPVGLVTFVYQKADGAQDRTDRSCLCQPRWRQSTYLQTSVRRDPAASG